jgi:hypothetical protein
MLLSVAVHLARIGYYLQERPMSDRESPETASHVQLERLQQQLLSHRFARIQSSWRSALWAYFVQGIAFGLGSFLGATIVVYFLVLALGQLEFIPIVGEWASQIIMEINQSKTDVAR